MDSTETIQQTDNPRNTIAKAGGRPPKFKMQMLPQVRKLARIGATELEIADFLGVDRGTITEWQSRYQKFSNALELGKSQSTKRVKRALYHRAIGYTHDAVKVFKGADDKPVIVPIREHVPPDTNAAVFWLKNREPDKWRDKIDIEGKIELGLADSLQRARARLKDANPQTIEGESIGDQSASE